MDAVEEVKQRLDIEDVIGEYVQLKRAGRNWRGLSPWTNEKTPSFIVSPDKQIWHDFSSGRGGNVFSFVMEMEGLDFKDALAMLARRVGVDLEQYRTTSNRGSNKDRLYAASEAAAHFYQVQFTKNRTALEYVLNKRKFTKQTALDWRLGYSPASGTALADYLKAKKFTSDEIKRAGLASSSGRDMFRGRLMIPLADSQGRIIGFTARELSESSSGPKYINTPATVLYDKSRHVFGLHYAKDSIRKEKFIVLTEGNLDVIASHQAGVKNVVATAGTALTSQHLKTLARFSDDIRLAFDADKAGVNAAERAIPLASRAGVSLSIIAIPNGKDPDELIKNHGVSAWRGAIDKPQYALDWLIKQYQAKLDVSSAKGKREFSDVLLPVVRQMDDPVEQDHYLQRVAEICQVSKEALSQKLSNNNADVPARRRNMQSNTIADDEQTAEKRKLEQHLLSILINRPELTQVATLVGSIDLNPMSQNVWKLVNKPDFKLSDVGAGSDTADYVKILVLEFEELYQDLDASELAYEVARLQSRLIELYTRSKKSQIAAALHEADEAKSQKLLNEAKELDNLLKQATRGG